MTASLDSNQVGGCVVLREIFQKQNSLGMNKLDEKFSRRYHCSYKLHELPCVPQHEKKGARVEWKSPWFQIVFKQVSQCSSFSAPRGTGQKAGMDWPWNGFLSHWQLSFVYSKKAPRNWISKTWHVIKAYMDLNAWKPHCEDVSGERCQRSCELDCNALSHPKEQSWLSDRICSTLTTAWALMELPE